MSNSTTKKTVVTTEIFILRAKNKHGDRYDYSSTIYKGMKSRLTIVCKIHGIFNQIANVHLSGSGCPKCKKNYPLDTKTFKKRASIKHGSRYIYTKSIYTGSEQPITITCRRHGDFQQIAKSHINGANCPSCRKHVFDNDTFIAKSKSIHGDRYDYLDDSFIDGEQNIKVICKKHGVFEQKMDNHFRRDGCKKCKTQRKMMSAAMACRDDRSSYRRDGYVKICKNNNGLSNLYVIEMTLDNEKFYKIGITKRLLAARFRSNPYQIKEIRFITKDAGFIFDLEKQLHRILSKYHYRPLKKFEGSTLECFSKIPKTILGLIDDMSKGKQLQLIT